MLGLARKSNSFFTSVRRVFYNSERVLSYNNRSTYSQNSAGFLSCQSDIYFKQRNFCSTNENQRKDFLMEFEPVFFPNLILSFKNWFFTKVIIQTYFDKDFRMAEFIEGAKQALVTISSSLSTGQFKELEGLVSSEALNTIQRNYASLDENHRKSLLIQQEDIFYAFAHQIGIILNDTSKKRFAEIMVVFHCVKDFQKIGIVAEELSGSEMFKKNLTRKVTVCNYRFIREFTKGVESSWTVNLLNHFRPDHI